MVLLKGSFHKDVEEITENWGKQLNEERPHESLGNLTPKGNLSLKQ
jgi:transposase InsO family protein